MGHTHQEQFAKGSVVSKLPRYRLSRWLAFTPSRQPHHQAVGKLKNLGASELTCQNTLGRVALCLYGYGGSWGRENKVCVSPVAGLNVNKKRPTQSCFPLQVLGASRK